MASADRAQDGKIIDVMDIMTTPARNATDLTGRSFCGWVVLRRAPTRLRKSVYVCRCVCGTEREVFGNNLVRGVSTNCGCISVRGNHSHGQTHTKIYRIWATMVQRCTNSRHKDFHKYGGRGIRVCDQWLVFERFFEDMGHKPDGLSLDRIDNNGIYEPGNCRWSAPKQQCRNTRKNRIVEHDNKKVTVAEWAETLGVPEARIRDRLRYGWSVKDALFGSKRKNQHG